MIYDSKALSMAQWMLQRHALLLDGWEVIKIEPKTMPPGFAEVYLRKIWVEKL